MAAWRSLGVAERTPDRDQRGWRLHRDWLRYHLILPLAYPFWLVGGISERVGDWLEDIGTRRWP